jgi:hypothetical protein
MADIKSPTERYKAIADAIREKNGTTELMHPADMPQAILDIVSGGGGDVIIGADYTNIVYNEDNTITLTDKDGVEHTMSCTYEDGKLIGVTYDGKSIALTYDDDLLVKVGKTAVDVANAPKEPLTTIKADSCVAEVILPVIVPTVTAEINNGTIEIDSSASLEE